MQSVRLGGLRRLGRSYATASPLKESYGLFINGQEVPSESGTYIDVEDPARGGTLTRVAEGREADMAKAIASAKEAFDDGRQTVFNSVCTVRCLLTSVLPVTPAGGPACQLVTEAAS